VLHLLARGVTAGVYCWDLSGDKVRDFGGLGIGMVVDAGWYCVAQVEVPKSGLADWQAVLTTIGRRIDVPVGRTLDECIDFHLDTLRHYRGKLADRGIVLQNQFSSISSEIVDRVNAWNPSGVMRQEIKTHYVDHLSLSRKTTYPRLLLDPTPEGFLRPNVTAAQQFLGTLPGNLDDVTHQMRWADVLFAIAACAVLIREARGDGRP